MLRIGHLSTFYHTSIIMIAKDVMGGEAQWKLFGTGPEIIDAFKRNEIDMAYVGLPPAVIGIDRGVRIKCIAGGHMEGTVICGSAQAGSFPEVNNPGEILKQFSGQAIGVPGKGSIHDVIVSDLIRKYSLEKEIRIINFKWADEIPEAMHRGEISIAAGTPALAAAVRNFLGGRILYPSSQLWPNNPSYGILVSIDLLNSGAEVIEKFLVLHEEAAAFIRKNPSEAAGIVSEYVGVVDKAFVLDTLSISPRYCACLTEEYILSTMEFVNVLKGLKYIQQDISRDMIFDTSLIKKIHPEADHYSDGISID